MIIESRRIRNIVINMLLGLVPELFLCYIASLFVDEGAWFFVFIYLGLQAVKFLVWLMRSLWGWLIYIIFGKKNMIRTCTDYLAENGFPDPGDYIESGEHYLREVAEDNEADIAVRLKAAESAGEFSAYRQTGQSQLLLKHGWALEDALIQHRRKFIEKRQLN